jgi:hypothetical protein
MTYFKKIIIIVALLFVLYFVYLFLKPYPVDDVYIGTSIQNDCVIENKDYVVGGYYNKIDNRCCKNLILVDQEDTWGAEHYQCISYNDYKWYKIKNSLRLW